MSYDVYFGSLIEENRSLLLTLLRLKEEAHKLEPEETELLARIRGDQEPAAESAQAPPRRAPPPPPGRRRPAEEPPEQGTA
jgi:hypothetical protein